MEIIKGSLDDISRPAPTEHTGSRVSSVSLPHADRICPTTPFSLVVLTNDSADFKSSSEETTNGSSNRSDCHTDVNEEETEASKLQKAIEEMQRLDQMLSAKISREKETKRQRKEIQAKLWQDLLQNTGHHSQCAQEALNTKLFLALEAPDKEEQDHFVPVFETQVTDCDEDDQDLEKSDKRPDRSTEMDFEDVMEEQVELSRCGSDKSKKNQNFVKRNIELVSGGEGQVLLTQSEKKRLAKLLREIEEEEEESVRGGESEQEIRAVSVLTGQGYTPEPSDLEQLIKIESKLRLLCPDEEFQSAQSSYTNFSVCRGWGSDIAWKYDRDPQPRGKALLYLKQRREQERRLHEVQQQLELLSQGQEMTDESPDLTEEQLLSLLDECALMESWSQDAQSNDTTP